MGEAEMKPRLLDLYCGAGGAAKGYQMAGFFVVGIDIKAQPRYCGDALVQMDVLEAMRVLLAGGYIVDTAGRKWYLSDFDAFHASPPCQKYTKCQRIRKNSHPDLISDTRNVLRGTNRPYAIENVPDSPLIRPVTLTGTMFGLRTVRPRLFESNILLPQPLIPEVDTPHAKMGRRPKEGEYIHVVGNFSCVECGKIAMGIDWMVRKELVEAIPPAYTELIGQYLMEAVKQ